MLKSSGRAGDKYSISLFLPEYSFPQHIIFIRSCPLQLKIIPHRFYQIGPLNHLCTFFFSPLFRNFYTGMYMMVLKCMSSRHGACSEAASWDLLWVDGGAVLLAWLWVVRKLQRLWLAYPHTYFFHDPFSSRGHFVRLSPWPFQPSVYELCQPMALRLSPRARSGSVVTVPDTI